MGKLEGKAAVVTGAGDGIGRGIARRFAREGARVWLAEKDAARGRVVAAEIGDEIGMEESILWSITLGGAATSTECPGPRNCPEVGASASGVAGASSQPRTNPATRPPACAIWSLRGPAPISSAYAPITPPTICQAR